MAAGKSTIATALMDAGYHRAAFADGVKEIASLAYGSIHKGNLYSINDLKQGTIEVTGRQILQRVGTEIKRIDQYFWLKYIEKKLGDVQRYVVDDGRFDFEVAWARDKGWTVVGVGSPEAARIQRYEIVYGRTPSKEELNHSSEQQVPQLLMDCDVNVQGTDDPYENAKKILEYERRAAQSNGRLQLSQMQINRKGAYTT